MNPDIPSVSGSNKRYLSVDFIRGWAMFFLIGGFANIFEVLDYPVFDYPLIETIARQFEHATWNGFTYFDAGQPGFMFIVGVAMSFSIPKRWKDGDSWGKTFRHALLRSLLLFLIGMIFQFVYTGEIDFSNVLVHLSFGYLCAFLMMRSSINKKIVFSFGLLILTELLYRTWPIDGFNQPFTSGKNFGSYLDLILIGKLHAEHYVVFNVIPSVAHIMWGVLAGHVMKSDRTESSKIMIFINLGLIGISLGLMLNPITPIIKRIYTSSFVILSGGVCFLHLAIAHWLVEIKKIKKVPNFFAVIGMNPLFIYGFVMLGGAGLIAKFIEPVSSTLFGWSGQIQSLCIAAITVWALIWLICYFFHNRKIFIKI